MRIKLLDPINFVDGYKCYWEEISTFFCGIKNPFLKYQLLNIIKTQGRIIWKSEEDELLLAV